MPAVVAELMAALTLHRREMVVDQAELAILHIVKALKSVLARMLLQVDRVRRPLVETANIMPVVALIINILYRDRLD